LTQETKPFFRRMRRALGHPYNEKANDGGREVLARPVTVDWQSLSREIGFCLQTTGLPEIPPAPLYQRGVGGGFFASINHATNHVLFEQSLKFQFFCSVASVTSVADKFSIFSSFKAKGFKKTGCMSIMII
jgi:hypothetical protein